MAPDVERRTCRLEELEGEGHRTSAVEQILIIILGVIQTEMAVRIRMTRMGTKKKPFYRIVAADSEAPRDGKFIEILGHYDPMKDPAGINVDEGKINSWLEKGARVSESVKSLLKKQGMLKSQSTAS